MFGWMLEIGVDEGMDGGGREGRIVRWTEKAKIDGRIETVWRTGVWGSMRLDWNVCKEGPPKDQGPLGEPCQRQQPLP